MPLAIPEISPPGRGVPAPVPRIAAQVILFARHERDDSLPSPIRAPGARPARAGSVGGCARAAGHGRDGRRSGLAVPGPASRLARRRGLRAGGSGTVLPRGRRRGPSRRTCCTAQPCNPRYTVPRAASHLGVTTCRKRNLCRPQHVAAPPAPADPAAPERAQGVAGIGQAAEPRHPARCRTPEPGAAHRPCRQLGMGSGHQPGRLLGRGVQAAGRRRPCRRGECRRSHRADPRGRPPGIPPLDPEGRARRDRDGPRPARAHPGRRGPAFARARRGTSRRGPHRRRRRHDPGCDRAHARDPADSPARVLRRAHRAAEPVALPREARRDARGRPPHRQAVRDHVPRPRPVQAHQRHARPPHGRRPAARRRAAAEERAACRRLARRHARQDARARRLPPGRRRVHRAAEWRVDRGTGRPRRNPRRRAAGAADHDRRARSVRVGVDRHRAVSARRRRPRLAAPQCRHRDVPREVRGSQPLRLLSRVDAPGDGAPALPRARAAARHRERAVRAALPAADRHADGRASSAWRR